MRQLDDRILTVRRDEGAFVDGDWVPSYATMTVVGSVQPLSVADTRALPEGVDRTRNMLKLYCAVPLHGARPQGAQAGSSIGHRPDQVQIGIAWYEVLATEFNGSWCLDAYSDLRPAHGLAPGRRQAYLLSERRPAANP